MSNPGSLLLKLIIDGTSAGAVRALAQTEAAAKGAGSALKTADAGGFEKTQASLTAIEAQLKGLQTLGRNALQFAGVGLGIAELIKLGDTYTNMTSRLKLVTQYTGDYDRVFAALGESARQTRSDLVGSVDLFVKMAPALRGIGLDGQQAAGIVTTINQAIATSGASAQAAQAALVQLGQGFGSGTLRGEELNSVLEQTPSLAMAIADGLGVPLGELRKLGEAGELTAEKVAGALQKMAPQIAADFAAMPLTVGQSLTALQNEFLLFVGATDSAAGGTSTLANVVNAMAQEFREAGPVVTAFSETIKIMINGFDGLYRMIKIVGLGLAGYAAAAAAALTGDFSGARTIWRELGADIDAVLQKPLLTEPKLVASAADTAKKREQLEAQLAVQVERLEKLKAYQAGEALDSVAKKEKENIDARIADQKRLVDAVAAAWKDTLKEAEAASEKARALRDKATDKKTAAGDKANELRNKDLSEEDKQALALQTAQDAQAQGSFAAAKAAAAQLEGRGRDFEKYSREAEKFLDRAMKFAESSGSASLIEDIGAQQAGLLERQAALEEKKAGDLKAQAEAQATLLNQLQAQLDKMKADARAIEVKADVTDAESKVKGLQGQLAALTDKTVTVTVNTVNAGGAATAAAGAAVPGYAFGGQLPGHAPHDRADNMLYWGTPGEWVIQRPAARYYGAAFMAAVNAMKLPKFAFGGQLGGSAVGRLAVPSLPPGGLGGGSDRNLTLVLDGQRYQVGASNDTIDRLSDFVSREALRKGGRR